MPTLIETKLHSPDFKNFVPKINKCLKLLKDKASAHRGWMDSYNLTIRSFSKSGANFANNTIDLGLLTFNSSETWLSSVLIHEAIHFWQYRTGKYDAKKHQLMEIEANKYQMTVLQLIGAPKSEIAHLAKQKGDHADLNGDGVFDEKDYEIRGY